jgi:hypothetical protein
VPFDSSNSGTMNTQTRSPVNPGPDPVATVERALMAEAEAGDVPAGQFTIPPKIL